MFTVQSLISCPYGGSEGKSSFVIFHSLLYAGQLEHKKSLLPSTILYTTFTIKYFIPKDRQSFLCNCTYCMWLVSRQTQMLGKTCIRDFPDHFPVPNCQCQNVRLLEVQQTKRCPFLVAISRTLNLLKQKG